MSSFLRETAHRPWPMPARPWAMRMRWDDLLFAHWRVPAAQLRALIPVGLELELWKGEAWVGVVPFSMRATRLRWLPPIPGTASFAELNLRTYVIADGKPGVWFFSLDAASWLAVRGARRFFHLPYFDARMSSRGDGTRTIYRSTRTHRGAPSAEFSADYEPTGEPHPALPGTLEHWLAERYCLYAADPRGRILRGEIHHAPWPLQPAVARIEKSTIAAAAGITLPDEPPHLLFARSLDVVAWLLE